MSEDRLARVRLMLGDEGVNRLQSSFVVVAGLGAALAVRFLTPVAFTWYVMIGATVTFTCGWVAGWLGRAWARTD